MCIIYVDISHLDAAQEKLASRANLEVDVFKVSTEHNDRAILEGTTRGDLDVYLVYSFYENLAASLERS